MNQTPRRLRSFCLRALPLLALALAPLGLAAQALAGREAPPGGNRDAVPVPVPVPASVFVSVNGSDGDPCTRSRPCASFNRAYQVANPGEVVEVSAGSYPPQAISYAVSKKGRHACDAATARFSGCITFRPAKGGDVILAAFSSEAAYVEIRDMTLRGDLAIGRTPQTRAYTCLQQRPFNNIVRRIRSTGAFVIAGAKHSAIVDSTFKLGNSYREDSGTSHIGGCGQAPFPVTQSDGILLDGVTMKDLIQTVPANQPGCTSWRCMHITALHVDQARNLTVRRSKFLNNAGHNVEIQNVGGRDGMKNLLFENNVFDATCSHQTSSCQDQGGAFVVDCRLSDGPIANVTVRFNSFNGFPPAWTSEDGCRFEGQHRVIGNIGGSMSAFKCDTYRALGVKYAYNVWHSGSARCGVTDKVVAAGYADPGRYDFRLDHSDGAAGFIPQSVSHPAVDLYGAPRPFRASLDAGAIQHDSSAIALGRSIGSVRIGMTEAGVVAKYGRTHNARVRTIGGERIVTAAYRVYGGRLWVTYVGGRVVGVSTTSPYYSTRSGLGVGAPLALGILRLWGRTTGCGQRLQLTLRGVSVELLPVGPRHVSTIARVSMFRSRYVGC